MRVLTFNIHKGFNWNNRDLTLAPLKQQLKTLHPDIVFLQEVVGENQKLASERDDWIENQFEFLADELWDEFAYAKNAVFDGRHHGNVIMSKFPIIKQEVINISTNPLERRGVLFCEIDLGEQIIHCYCVHLNLTHGGRIKQYDLIKDIIESNSSQKEKIILAGDFNDWNQKASSHLFSLTEAHKKVHGHYAKTFPAKFPLLKLDRVYLRGVNVVEIQTLKGNPWSHFSDHLPLLAELQVHED